MKTNIKATNIELTSAIETYLAEKLSHLDKLIKVRAEDEVMAQVELGKESRHHKHGEVFRAEINLRLGGKTLRAVANSADLYAAIDELKDEISQEIKSSHRKQAALGKRGGRLVKNILQGN